MVLSVGGDIDGGKLFYVKDGEVIGVDGYMTGSYFNDGMIEAFSLKDRDSVLLAFGEGDWKESETSADTKAMVRSHAFNFHRLNKEKVNQYLNPDYEPEKKKDPDGGRLGTPIDEEVQKILEEYIEKIRKDEVILTDGYTAAEYSYLIESGVHPRYEIRDINLDGRPELFITVQNNQSYAIMYYVKDGEVIEAFPYSIYEMNEKDYVTRALGPIAADRFEEWYGFLGWNGSDWEEFSDRSKDIVLDQKFEFRNGQEI